MGVGSKLFCMCAEAKGAGQDLGLTWKSPSSSNPPIASKELGLWLWRSWLFIWVLRISPQSLMFAQQTFIGWAAISSDPKIDFTWESALSSQCKMLISDHFNYTQQNRQIKEMFATLWARLILSKMPPALSQWWSLANWDWLVLVGLHECTKTADIQSRVKKDKW